MDAKEEGLRETIEPGRIDQPGDRVGTKSKENAGEESASEAEDALSNL